MDSLLLGMTITAGVLLIVGTQLFMARLVRHGQESLAAIRRGERHIAALAAEVLRRPRP